MTKILYIDIDSLRPDHLGCAGYHRDTSPNIDILANEGVRFTNCYVSDAPCLPSRTAFFSGRFGIHNGVMDHGGIAAEPFPAGPNREFFTQWGSNSLPRRLRDAGLYTATISSFGERHSAWHWHANFNEIINPGLWGLEVASDVSPLALDWIERNAHRESWFLHINFWDPHQPYRTPLEFGEPFENDPIPEWLTEEIRERHWNGYGPQSAREVTDYAHMQTSFRDDYPRQPHEIATMDDVCRMFDGYDTGIRYTDEHIGRLMNALADANVLDETIVVISGDHGECLGEFNIYGGHRLADEHTTHLPLIIRVPGSDQAGTTRNAFHYHVDIAATLIELAGGTIPENWDGEIFTSSLNTDSDTGRDYLVVSQAAVSCQRGVRFDDYIYVQSYHGGYHEVEDEMLFNLVDDPHEQHNLRNQRPEIAQQGIQFLQDWLTRMMLESEHAEDRMWTVLRQGGAVHSRGELPNYIKRLRATGRADKADLLLRQYASDTEG